MLDVEKIRRDFPILAREVYGKPLVYLDNAASAQKPKPVLDAIMKSYTEEYANVHRGLHFLSNAATQSFEDARESVRRFLNAPSKDQLIFTRNATEAINLVAQSFGGLVIKLMHARSVLCSLLVFVRVLMKFLKYLTS